MDGPKGWVLDGPKTAGAPAPGKKDASVKDADVKAAGAMTAAEKSADVKREDLQSAEVKPPKRDWKRIASTVLFLVLIGLLAAYIWQNREDFRQLLNLSGGTVALMLLLGWLGCVVNCAYHLVILKTYDISLSLVDWMGVVSVSNAIAYVLPMRADLLFSAAYYKRVKGLAYTKSVSMAAGNIVFGVAFSLLQILVALLCMGFLDGQWPATLWILWVLGTAALTVFIVFSLLVQGKQPKIMQRYKLLGDVVEGFNALLLNRKLLWQLLLCLIGNNLAQLLLYMVCFRAVGLPITLYEALFYNSISWLSSIVAIVPGNIGIKESVMGIGAMLMGSVLQTGVAVSLLHRVAVMVVYIVMGLIFAIPVYRRFTQGQESPEGDGPEGDRPEEKGPETV